MYRTAFINTSSESFLNNIEIKSNFIPTHIVKLRAKKSLLCTIKNIFGKLEELNRAGSFIFFFYIHNGEKGILSMRTEMASSKKHI